MAKLIRINTDDDSGILKHLQKHTITKSLDLEQKVLYYEI